MRLIITTMQNVPASRNRGSKLESWPASNDDRAAVVWLGQLEIAKLAATRPDPSQVDQAKANVPVRRRAGECWR